MSGLRKNHPTQKIAQQMALLDWIQVITEFHGSVLITTAAVFNLRRIHVKGFHQCFDVLDLVMVNET